MMIRMTHNLKKRFLLKYTVKKQLLRLKKREDLY